MFPAGGLRAHHRWQCPQRRMPAWVNMLPDETWLPFTRTKRHFSPGRGGNRTEPENISSKCVAQDFVRASFRPLYQRASEHSTFFSPVNATPTASTITRAHTTEKSVGNEEHQFPWTPPESSLPAVCFALFPIRFVPPKSFILLF